MSRLFSNPSGNLFGGAVDHFVGYGNVREGGLADLPGALARVMAGEPDYVSIQPGAARHLWPAYAGKAALVIQAGCFTPDDRIRQLIATPEDAVRYGADALAVAIPVRGDTEGEYIRWLTDTVNAAARFEMPVIAHVYPRDFANGGKIVFTPDEIAYAVRIGFETGVDVIKVGYTGDFESFRETVATCPVAGRHRRRAEDGHPARRAHPDRRRAARRRQGGRRWAQPVGPRRHDEGRPRVQARHPRRHGAARRRWPPRGGLTGGGRASGAGVRRDRGRRHPSMSTDR